MPPKEEFEEVIRQKNLQKAKNKNNKVFLLNPPLRKREVGTETPISTINKPKKKLTWIGKIKQRFTGWKNTSK